MSPLPISGMAVSSALSEAFALTGKLPLKLDETVVPVIIVGDLSRDLWGPPAVGAVSAAAAAGFRSELELALPWSGSTMGLGVIIDSIDFVAGGAAMMYTVTPSPGLAGPTVEGEKAWLNTGTPASPFLRLHYKNTAVATIGGINVVQVRVPANTTKSLDLGWVISALPGGTERHGLMIRPTADNMAATITVHWRERLPR